MAWPVALKPDVYKRQNWGSASDNLTAASSLEYKIVKDNTGAANINTVALADAKTGGDLLQDWTANITTKAVTGLAASTTYYFTVLVRDAAGNKAVYPVMSQATIIDTIAPTLISSNPADTACLLYTSRCV